MEFASQVGIFDMSDLRMFLHDVARARGLQFRHSGVRSALHRLLREGKLAKFSRTQYVISGFSDISISVSDFAARNNISPNAAKLRLYRMTKQGRAILVAPGRFVVLPDEARVVRAFFSLEEKRSDDKGRPFILLYSESYGIRFYLNDEKIDALLEGRYVDGSIWIVVGPKWKAGKFFRECIAILSSDQKKILWYDKSAFKKSS